MQTPVPNPYLVPFDGTTALGDWATKPPKDAPDESECKKQLKKTVNELADLQRILYAHDNHAVLLVFQAMDAAGKDSTIRHVLSGLNPTGVVVHSFKQPSSEELEHDFLWRTACRLPERGKIGVFNRSYYEEVLAVRVHPEYLQNQRIAYNSDTSEDLWRQRFVSIRDHELHLARNGTVILKFWLNVSKDEQRKRFLSRLEEPEKNWKFSEADIAERKLWPKYMSAYQEVLAHTSRQYAPWYAIPADNKPYMRLTVAKIILERLKSMNLRYPAVDENVKKRFKHYEKMLKEEKV